MWKLNEFKEKTELTPWPEVILRSGTPYEYFWSFKLTGHAKDLWYYLADTSRFNRELDLAPRKEREENGQLIVTSTLVGFHQEWVEEPWTWVAGRSVCANRVYRTGFVHRVRAFFHVEPAETPGESYVYLYFAWQPRNPFWRLFLKSTESILKKKFEAVFHKIEAHLAKNKNPLLTQEALKVDQDALTTQGSTKLQMIRDELIEKNLHREAVNQLCRFVEEGDPYDLYRIRVLPLARRWNIQHRDLLVTCLHATRLGLLQLSWDVICPHCRGVRYEAKSLGDVPSHFDCEACEANFSTDKYESIEVTFHVHPSVRIVEEVNFCAAEPTKKDHIKVQQMLGIGEDRKFRPTLHEGIHRLRVRGDDKYMLVDVHATGENSEIKWDGSVTAPAIYKTGPAPVLHITNSRDKESLFIFEELWWQSRALHPAEVLTLPEFRDLFSEEHLNIDVKISLGQQTILFTDIVGSTTFYRNVGDGRAFREVKNHFTEIFRDVKAHHGVVIKTIGDAVMAAFHSPENAMKAAIQMQQRFHPNRPDTQIRIRVSIHSGPVMAVHLHQGIDYFGGTVNYAAKLQALADSGEIAMSEEIFRVYSQFASHDLAFPLVTKPAGQKSGELNQKAYVIQIDRRQSLDRRKSA